MTGPPTPEIPRTTAAEMLACFDGDFAGFAAAFVKGQYVVWLGSGLSRGVVPDVSSLLRNLLVHLQGKVDNSDTECRYRRALREIVAIGALPGGDQSAIDFSAEVVTWPALDDLISRLVGQYSKVLDVVVDGEDRDYLVWDAIDAAGVYGDGTLNPDAEHICVAILMLEGVIRAAPTTNWDGLIELAVDRLSGNRSGILRVVVHQDDFLGPAARTDLIKFHGCAVRAKADPGIYRDLLVARHLQISGWTATPANKITKDHLEHLVATRPALVVGLSAQDANIHTILHEARQNMHRSWPDDPPAVAFALHSLGPDQTHVLDITYGDDYFPNRQHINQAALLGGYAKPVLLGLVLFTIADKLCSLVEGLSDLGFSDAGVARLQGDIRFIRDLASESAIDARAFADELVSAVCFILETFRTGSPPAFGSMHYAALTAHPISEEAADPNFPGQVLGWLAVALSLLGRGCSDGSWTIRAGDPSEPENGQVRVDVPGSSLSKVFVAQGAAAVSRLVADGYLDESDPDVLLVYAEDPAPRPVRSPSPKLGRTRKLEAREVSMETLSRDAEDADDLFNLFRLGAGL